MVSLCEINEEIKQFMGIINLDIAKACDTT